jgi:hypothetical protein
MANGTIVTLRPNEMFNAGDWWAVVGGPSSVNAALADDSDATYATTTGNPGWVGMTNLDVIPNGARIISVTIRVRWQGDGSTYGAVGLTDNILGQTTPFTAFYQVPAAIRIDSYAAATRPDGSAWTVDAVNSITVMIQGSGTGLHFVELYADVLYNQAPVVSNVTPSGSIADQQPTIGWAYHDPDGDAQERWQVKVFADAVASSSGFTAATSPAVADSGNSYYASASATSWTPPAPLSPGVYRAYVRAADAGSNGRYSDWATGTFTVVGDPPGPPALLSVAPNPAEGRVEIEVRQADNLLNQQTAGADGLLYEFLRWYVYGNATPPVVATGTGLEANGISCVVAADGEVALSTLRLMPILPGVETIWAGWIKSSGGGTMHLDVGWFAGDSFLQMDNGSYVGLSGDMQVSQGSVVPPDDADGALLMWRSSGPLSGGQSLTWDDCYISFTREDEDLSEIEARLAALEDAIVDLQIRVALLQLRTPTITITPSQVPIDSTAYRGGLDSSNLLGPADGSFQYPLTGTNWVAYAGTGFSGLLNVVLDGAAYDGYSLAMVPGTVGGNHWFITNITYPLPLVDAQYQLSFRHRATNVAGATADGLFANAAIVWTDDNWTVVGAGVSTGTFPLVDSDEFSDPMVVTAYPPPGATRFYVQIHMTGESNENDRWLFDRFQVVRVPEVLPDYSFGEGPFGYGPFGGGDGPPVMLWKPASQVDVYPYVEWSADGGDTWAPVRRTAYAAYDPATRTARVYDYEAPLGVEVLYRARTAARDYQTDPRTGVWIISTPTTTRAVTLTVDGWYLVDPYSQTRVPFRIVADSGIPQLSMSKPTPQQDFAPVGRPYKIILSDVAKGNEFTWKILVPSAADWDAMDAMVTSGRILLVQSPLGRSWYVLPGAARQLTAPLVPDADLGAVIELTGYEQERPAA